MNLPVFEHTIASLSLLVQNEEESLQKVSDQLKYDPGLYFSLLKYINSSGKRTEITSISQAISLIGAQGLEKFILDQDYYLGGEYMLFWCYAVLAGETAALVDQRAAVADDDEAFFAGMLPSVGMLLMLKTHPQYRRITELLMRVPIEQRIFIEEGLYKTNHVEQLDMNLSSPKIYRDVIDLMLTIFTKDGRQKKFSQIPSRLSIAHQAFQLLRLIDTAEAAARAILFPAVVEAQEKFREFAKMYFKIPESEIEDLLSEVLERFERACSEFKVESLSGQCTMQAENYLSPSFTFLTKAENLKQALENIYKANAEGRSILIYGESSVGKRLLALSLHYRPDNPRKDKPFLSIHCSSLAADTFEAEMCGSKGCFLRVEKHRGALAVANGGTILLKDIDIIPMVQQDALADIIKGGTSHNRGEFQPLSFDIRFIVTSLKDIVDEAKEGRFSEKLLSALNPASICIPPLRERREDIEPIAESVISKYDLNLTDKALLLGLHEYYETQSFPDNLRDLKRLLFFFSAKHSLKA